MGDSKRIDVRSDRGYVAAPYSMRGDGKRYEWLKHPDNVGLADPPEWFLKLLQSARALPLRAPLSVKGANSADGVCRNQIEGVACVFAVTDKGAQEGARARFFRRSRSCLATRSGSYVRGTTSTGIRRAASAISRW